MSNFWGAVQTLLFFISIALLEPYQDVLIKVDP